MNPLPDYQQDLHPPIPPSVNPGHKHGRGFPDVAGDAAVTSGYQIVVGGEQQTIGGTSAVAPLWAALIVLLNQSLNARVGFLNPMLYSRIGPEGALRDITSGNNGAYKADKGWDPCTGWGVPDGQALRRALQ
ncbi:MAG: hypothetical protein JOZ53_28355 [Planctomycetaceae bacterium]|nr:hypothetical protein [Planctomycetaceae bacterium]